MIFAPQRMGRQVARGTPSRARFENMRNSAAARASRRLDDDFWCLWFQSCNRSFDAWSLSVRAKSAASRCPSGPGSLSRRARPTVWYIRVMDSETIFRIGSRQVARQAG